MKSKLLLLIAITLGNVNFSGCTVGNFPEGASQDSNEVIHFRNGRYENSRGEEIKVNK